MLTAIVAIVIAVGVIGTVVPFVPGLLMIWGAALVWGLFTDSFTTGGWVLFGFITFLTIVATLLNFIIPSRKAGTAGASGLSIAFGLGCAFVGFFAIPVFGLIIGGVGGIYAGERLRGVEHEPAWHATVASMKGYVLAMLVELGAGLMAAALWVMWVIAI